MDEREYTRRVEAMERKLYRTCAALLGSDADCADAVQEALIKAWRALPTLKQEQYFETWLTRIAINECRSMLRRKRSVQPLDPRMSAPPPDMELRRAISELDEKLKLPVVMHYVNGFDVEETARILRLPQGTVKSRLHRARAQLRKLLEEDDI